MKSWSEYTDADLQLLNVYKRGVDFLTEALNKQVEK